MMLLGLGAKFIWDIVHGQFEYIYKGFGYVIYFETEPLLFVLVTAAWCFVLYSCYLEAMKPVMKPIEP